MLPKSNYQAIYIYKLYVNVVIYRSYIMSYPTTTMGGCLLLTYFYLPLEGQINTEETQVIQRQLRILHLKTV